MSQSIQLLKIASPKAENAILRFRCPKQVQTTPAERALLIRLARPLGTKVKRIPFASLKLSGSAERFVRSAKSECLEHFVVFGENHQAHLLREHEEYNNTVRPYQRE